MAICEVVEKRYVVQCDRCGACGLPFVSESVARIHAPVIEGFVFRKVGRSEVILCAVCAAEEQGEG